MFRGREESVSGCGWALHLTCTPAPNCTPAAVFHHCCCRRWGRRRCRWSMAARRSRSPLRRQYAACQPGRRSSGLSWTRCSCRMGRQRARQWYRQHPERRPQPGNQACSCCAFHAPAIANQEQTKKTAHLSFSWLLSATHPSNSCPSAKELALLKLAFLLSVCPPDSILYVGGTP